MKGVFGKKQILLATLVVALGLAVYLNYYFVNHSLELAVSETAPTKDDSKLGEAQYVNTEPTDETAEAGSYFTQARENRENSRDEEVDIVKDILNNAKATADMKQQAAEKIKAITSALEQESKIENLIRAKGFTDCVVYLGEGGCQVVVKSEGLQVQDTAQIQEIVLSQSAVEAQNIQIIAVNS